MTNKSSFSLGTGTPTKYFQKLLSSFSQPVRVHGPPGQFRKLCWPPEDQTNWKGTNIPT